MHRALLGVINPPSSSFLPHLLCRVQVHLPGTGLHQGTAANGPNVHPLSRQPVPGGQSQV